jgi:type IV pilus assembly protein PilC
VPVFVYSAYSRSGNLVRGERVARSTADLKQDLLQEDLLASSVSRKLGLISLTFRARRVGSEELFLLVQEFVALLRAGLPIPEVLTHLAQRPGQPVLQGVLTQVAENIQKGTTLSVACSKHPEIFDSLFVAACSTGEASGQIVKSLERYQQNLRRAIALRKTVKQALIYPLFLLLVLVGVLGALFFVILPRFTNMYAQLNTELPKPTQVLMNFVEHLPYYLLGTLSITVLIWVVIKVFAKSDSGRAVIDNLKSKSPIIGQLYSAYSMAKMTRMLATLIETGTPLMTALETTAVGLNNRQLGNSLLKSAKQISEGARIGSAFSSHQILTPTAQKIVEAGEMSGRLPEMLGEVADYFEEWLEGRLRNVTSMIEPVMMLLIGLLVGGVIIVMYLPVFGMADLIQ